MTEFNARDEILKAWTEHTRAEEGRKRPTTAPAYVYASRWHVCDRAMALALLHPEDAGEFNDTTLERFYRGNEIERSIAARLYRAGAYGGFTVEGGQERYEIHGRDLRYDDGRTIVVIVGKTDGKIVFKDRLIRPIPFDVKSGASVQHIETIEQLLEGRWTRAMMYQILAYCYGGGADRGFLILDKPAGPTFLEIVLEEHLDKMEEFLAAAEMAVYCRNLDDDKLPPFYSQPAECFTCDHFKKSCHPPVEFGEGVQLVTDAKALELAAKVVELRALGKEYNSADRALKKKLRGIEIGDIGGEFDVLGKWQKSTKTVYPERCPRCRTMLSSRKVEDPKGKFVIKKLEPKPTEGE